MPFCFIFFIFQIFYVDQSEKKAVNINKQKPHVIDPNCLLNETNFQQKGPKQTGPSPLK